MAEVIGTIASVLTLVGLLKGCIDACELIRAAKNHEKDLEKLDLKLALEQCRLRSWGKSMGLIREAGEDRPSLLEHFEDRAVVQQALKFIMELLTDSERLSSRYGARQTAVEEGVQLVAKSRSVSKLKAAFKRLTITDSAPKQAINTTGVIRQVILLFHDRHDLLRRFSLFLPPGYAIFDEGGALQVATPDGYSWDIASFLAESADNEATTLSEETESVRTNAPLREKPGRCCRVKRLSRQLDMNSLVVLSYYEELVLFRQDIQREVLIFRSDLSLARQHAVCTLSRRLGLSYSKLAGETNQIVVGRLPQKPSSNLTPLRKPLMTKSLKDSNRTAISSEDTSTSWELEEQGSDMESEGWETASSEAENSDQ